MNVSWIKYTLAQKYPPRSPLWRGALGRRARQAAGLLRELFGEGA